ncbi:MAG TPA: winged helix family transcriptional regulator [Saprospirales bacterium]|nr:winged helix family transcriptional regulator [Saprospirales bacterium]
MKGILLKHIGLFSVLLVLSFLLMQFVWRVSGTETPSPGAPPPDKVNLALRRTAHLLLQAAGDSTSRIPPVEQTALYTWLIRLERNFDYTRLPALLEASLKQHQISIPYDVSVVSCTDNTILLGYNQADIAPDQSVPCQAREMDALCNNLQVSFLAPSKPRQALPLAGWIISALLASVLYWLGLKRWQPAIQSEKPAYPDTHTSGVAWLTFGQSRLDVSNQRLECGQEKHHLTYREAKLLHLFVQHPNQVLERNTILDQVWADEGVLVGRSVDMFVSRLRKLLKSDETVQIVAVHGVGYRMEIGVF